MPVYEITKYPMIGRDIYTYKEVNDVVFNNGKFIDVDTWQKPVRPINVSFSTNIKDYYLQAGSKFLPYTATVIEDTPAYVKGEPTVYYDCKLMEEKHGSYIQFFHEETGKVLLIALNSHYYIK